MKKAWTIYNPVLPVSELKLYRTKKEATAEWNRMYSGDIGNLIKEFAPNSAKIIPVDIHTPNTPD